MSITENQTEVTFEQAITTLFRRLACEEIQTVHPGTIKSYDENSQEAEVTLQVDRKYIDGTSLELPIIAGVPVMQYRTQNAMVELPIVEGDRVLVIFSKSSLDEYLNGGKKASYSPRNQFLMTDAVALPGLFPFSEPNTKGDPQKIVIKQNGDIEIGNSGLSKLLTENFKTDVETAITALGGSVIQTGQHLTQKTKAQ